MGNPKVTAQKVLGTQQLSSHDKSKFFQLLIIPKRTFVLSEILPRKIVGKCMKIIKTNKNSDLESYLLVTGLVWQCSYSHFYILLTYRIVFCRWCLVHVYPSHPCPSETVPSTCQAISSLCQSTARAWLLCWSIRWRRRTTHQRSVQSAKINSDCNIIGKTLWSQFCRWKHCLEVLSAKPCPFFS